MKFGFLKEVFLIDFFKMVKKIFIDTNVLVGYLLILGIMKTKLTEKRKKQIGKHYKKFKLSYDFICKVKENKDKKYKFVTSHLSISEIYLALYDEAICKKMWDDGIPLSAWVKKKDNFKKLVKEYEIDELKKKVKTLRNMKNLERIGNKYNFDLIARLIMKYNLMTQDSILFSTALKRDCSFFVTRDEKDFTSNNKLKEKFKKIELLSPEDALEKFFS